MSLAWTTHNQIVSTAVLHIGKIIDYECGTVSIPLHQSLWNFTSIGTYYCHCGAKSCWNTIISTKFL